MTANHFKPSKPGVLFVEHRQTVQTQIRHCIIMSDQDLYFLLTEYSIKIKKKEKNTTQHP